MFTNDLSKTTDSHRLAINASRLKEINVSQYAAIIGINTEGSENIILDFSSKYDSATSTYEQQSMTHTIIQDNRGVLTGFDIHNLHISYLYHFYFQEHLLQLH